MERPARKQLIELLSTVEEGIGYIKVSGQTEMFEECATGVTTIAQACQNGLSAERYSSGYAQLFETLAVAMRQSSGVLLSSEVLDETCELCCKLLQMVVKELQYEKEVKKEILFLPYKASMWDSLESIWLAAREDESCDVYVMPIPYCDRNPNGAAANWYCESGLFPGYVPLVDYRHYDIAERRPDVIYIHNPYDGCNLVTSVDSHYYSHELKKHTAMLVYVPYFISGKEWPEAHVQLACYQYMDKMIVPREDMRIRAEQGQLLDSCLSDYIPAKTLVPLGSPKADRVFFCEKNKKIPVAWKKNIRGKKVILYNISLSSVLRFGEKALQKMKYIFDCFVGKTDVVLLWRPHPLMEATLKSMRPELYREYKILETEFINKRIGILDNTPDITMAVAIADAYLGEASSSVIHLFGIAGKPLFFTNIMLTERPPSTEELMSVRFGKMDLENGEVWFVAETYNTLCRMELASGRITPLKKLNDSSTASFLYGGILKADNCILLAPNNAQQIYEYSLETGECKKTGITEPLECGNFGRIVRYKKFAFLLPWRYPAILRYDLETGECAYYTDCLKELLACRTQVNDKLLGDYCIRGNKLLLPSVQTNKVLEFNMDSGEHQLYTVGDEPAGCAFILENDDNYWLIPWKTKAIVKWDYQSGEWKAYNDYPEQFYCERDRNTGDTYMFSGAVKMNGSIWLFPCYANMILRLDLSTETIEKMELALPYGFYERKSPFYQQQPNFFNAFACDEDMIAALSAYDRSLVIVDTTTEEFRLQPCRLAQAEAAALSVPFQQLFGTVSSDAPYAVQESNLLCTVPRYIDYVLSGNHDTHAQKAAYEGFINNADGSCGEKIHQYIMRQVRNARK